VLEIRLFGQPRFALDGRALHISLPPRALLIAAYLLLHPKGTVSRETLAFTLWPDESEGEARVRLRKYLYRVTKALSLDDISCIAADGDGLRWNERAPHRLDVAQFDDFMARGRYDDAIALYEGELLDGFYDDWIMTLRERYRAAFFVALDDRLLAARRVRDLATSQAYAHRILSADPWREDVVRALMSTKYEGGDRIGALRVFDAFAKRAREEMNVDPMSDTIALRDAIVRGAAPVYDDAHGDDPGSGVRPRFPLVGREVELHALRNAWERAARCRGVTVIISGEAGIGKTRLAREIALIAQSEGARVLWGVTQRGETRPYNAIAEAIEQSVGLFANIALERPWLDALATLIPSLRDVVGAGTPPAIAPEREQHRLIDAIVHAVRAIATSRPTVLVLEDVQWASTASSLAIERLVGATAGTSLLVILTHRDDEATPTAFGRMRGRLGVDARVEFLPLGRLPQDAIREFVRAARAGTATKEEIVRIEEIAGGNPLLMISSLHADLGVDALVLPAALALARRFDALSEETTHFAEFAAIAGPRFGFDEVREAAGCSEREAFDAVNALLDARVIEERPAAGTFAFRFSHALLRDALYARIDDRARRRRHDRMARVLERLYHHDPRRSGEIAEHYERSGDMARAAEHIVRASEYAASVFAHVEARTLASHALEASALTAGQRRRALWVVAEASWRLGNVSATRDALLELEGMPDAQAQELCRILYRRSELEFAAGDRLARLRAIADLERVASTNALPTWLSRARIERIHSDVYAAVPGVLRAAQAEVGHIEETGDPRSAVRLFAVLCTACIADLEAQGAAFYAAQAQAIADSSEDSVLQSVALKAALSVAHQRQDFARVRELAQRMIELARCVGDSLYEASGYAYLANASYGLGDVQSTRAAYAEALQRLQGAGDRANYMRAALNCAVFECEEGFLEDAREHALRAQGDARAASDRVIEHRATLVLATLEIEREKYAEARALLEELLNDADLDPQTRTGVLEESGRTAIGERSYARAIADLGAALQGFESLAQRWYARRVRAELALANALDGRAERARALCDWLRDEQSDAEPPVFARRVNDALDRCGKVLALSAGAP
jgi:DNA-binding SARP family transcriptional activator/predicted ATPase